MSLDTLINPSFFDQQAPTAAERSCALVLMGGGARTAYQAGVLKALARVMAMKTVFRSGGCSAPRLAP